jgi:hypothetical protein
MLHKEKSGKPDNASATKRLKKYDLLLFLLLNFDSTFKWICSPTLEIYLKVFPKSFFQVSIAITSILFDHFNFSNVSFFQFFRVLKEKKRELDAFNDVASSIESLVTTL